MYPQSPPFFYTQQPLPQLPPFEPFDYQYTQQPPPQFDPYEPCYNTPKRRDRVSETLPIREDTDDDEYLDHVNVVPETQPMNEEAVQVEQDVEEVEVKRPKKKVNTVWTPDEEEALAKAWIKISVDRDVGDRQTKDGFWRRVHMHFKSLMPRTERNKDQLNSKWNPMHTLSRRSTSRLKESGCDDLQVYERAQLDFEKQYKKAFAHTKAWRILKDQEKWKQQASVGQTQESTGSSKKRKSSESSSAQTPIDVEDFECELPNLNENPTPSRQPKGKKKVNSADSSRSSMRDTLASYAAEKKNLMQSQLEIQKKKDDEFFKFIDGEVYNRDMKFVMDPHDHIPDPAFKEFVIQKKREICAKYGWPCSL
ncbi:myb-like domain, Myb/SANT-like DNA-binding domain protein [Artemisia annua]|uniref:Myb-like domain, Myb/SANT-like DNA-binding domain protein n=1 Tax=Artemisia annua TaxID=35608 RepID=A0A2U1M0C9_ARTAN|nr:myb-like domain, Myb/SANT-like DNA-binding domain protein [Artemisia annua]